MKPQPLWPIATTAIGLFLSLIWTCGLAYGLVSLAGRLF